MCPPQQIFAYYYDMKRKEWQNFEFLQNARNLHFENFL